MKALSLYVMLRNMRLRFCRVLDWMNFGIERVCVHAMPRTSDVLPASRYRSESRPTVFLKTISHDLRAVCSENLER